MPVDAVRQALESTENGLTEKEAAARHRTEGDNTVFALPHTSAHTCAAYICSDLSVLLLVITAIISVIWGESGGAILLLVALNCGAAVFTYIKARRIIESMTVCAMPRVRVLRDGKLFALDARLLVRGDVILFEAGDVIPCDARLTSADGLAVLEYRGKIGGKTERGRVTKDADFLCGSDKVLAMGEQLNMVFAGSIVLEGRGRAIVAETGEDTLLVATEGLIPIVGEGDRMPALEALKRHCGRSSLIMLGLILPLTLGAVLLPGLKMNLLDGFLLSLSLAVSSVSELTAAIGCIVVGSGLLRSARDGENAAVMLRLRDIPAIARTDTVVLFDASSLTEGRITVTASCYGTSPLSPSDPAGARELVETALIAAGLPSPDAPAAAPGGGAETEALLAFAGNCGVDAAALRSKTRLLGYAAASETNPFDTALIEEQRAPYVICRGELGQILDRCQRVVDPVGIGGTGLLRADRRAALMEICRDAISRGGYAVAYARRSSPYTTLNRLSAVQSEMILIGVLVFCDPVALNVTETVEALAGQGVRVVLMSDCPDHARMENLARTAGILRRGVICRAPAAISPDAELCLGYTPAAQRAWLTEQRSAGHLTLGLGEKMRDLAAVQACAVSGASSPVSYSHRRENRILNALDPGAGELYGAELLKKNAGLLVRRPHKGGGGICALDAARRAARRIEANLASAMRCLLAAQSMRTVMLICLLCLGISDLKPLHLLFSGLILDFGAILVCAFDRGGNAETPKSFFVHPMRYCFADVLIGAVCGGGAVLTVHILRLAGVFTAISSQTGAFLFATLVLTQLAFLFVCRRGTALFRGSRIGLLWPAAVLGFVLLCGLWPALGGVFGVCAIPLSAMLCLLISPMAAVFGGEIIRTVKAVRELRRAEMPEYFSAEE